MATTEDLVAALTTATNNLLAAVATQQTGVNTSVTNFSSVITRVNSELNNVDNTADADKPISTTHAAAIALKQNTLVSGTNISTVNGLSLLSGDPLVIERSATSLDFKTYDNRGTLRTLTPQIDDSTLVEGLGMFMWVNSKEEPDDDETCFNTTNGQWLLQVPAVDLINAWKLFDNEIIEDWMEDEQIRFSLYNK